MAHRDELRARAATRREQNRAAHADWVARNYSQYRAGLRRYPERIAARNAVNNRVVSGRLLRAQDQDCVDCGVPAEQYDHYLGYEREHRLDVQPVCRSCHADRDAARGEHRKAA